MFWGPDYIALYNDAYAPTIGDKHPSALGRPASEGWRELWDDLEPLLRSVRMTGETVFAKDRPFYIERHGYGEEVFFDISYSSIPDDDGSVGGVLCIVSETTERVKAQRRAMLERDRLWNLSLDPFLVADKDGLWIAVSPAWTDLLGWTESELLGRTSQWMEHPDDVEKTRGEVSDLAVGRTTMRFENRFRTKDGDYRWFSWSAVPQGDLIYAVARDITAEKEAAAQMRRTEELLRQAQKMETIGQLTGGVSHDFNNLLQVITGNLDTLLRRLPDDNAQLRRAAERAMTGARRAATLTQRLLAFSRRQPLAPTRCDPNRLISDMSDLLHRTLGEIVQIETVQAAGVWPIEADINQLENSLLNLAINARDAMPGGGKLTIETSNTHFDRDYAERHIEVVAGQYVMISVSDTGKGMDADTLAHVFEPFFTTKEVGKGTGLGLSMVYGFVKQSGGHIRVYSEPGNGTTVRLYFPRALSEVAGQAAAAPPAQPQRAHGETILVCEDDHDVRANSVELLSDLGYRVLEAADGPSAMTLMEQYRDEIELLFTDVVLPNGMTGAVLAERALALVPGLPVLFTTGYARNAIVHHGRLDPGVELITKPFTSTELAERIRDLLDKAQASAPRQPPGRV